jgi:hypothetical protein
VERVLDLIKHEVAEADFFLNSMRDSGFNIFGFHCYFSAFMSASRSITFALQAVMSGTPGFAEWYEIARQPLVEDSRARFFVQLRNIATKTGELGVTGGSSRLLDDGKTQITHHFDPELTKSLLEDELHQARRKPPKATRHARDSRASGTVWHATERSPHEDHRREPGTSL